MLLNRRSTLVPVTHIILALLISLGVGVTAAIFSQKTLLWLVIPIILFILISNKLYDFLLYAYPVVFLFAQFHIAALDLTRWFLLALLVLLSAYLILRQKLSINPVALGLGLVAFYSIVTSYLSYYPTVSLLKGISLLLLAGFLLLMPPAIQRLYPRIGIKEYILRMYLYLAIAVVLSNAIYYLLRPFSTVGFHSSGSLLAGRFRGWFMTPNGIGALYGIFFIPILWSEIWKRKMGSAKLGLLFVFLLAFIQLLASQSRAGILAGTASLLVLILGPRKWASRVMILGMLGLLVLAIYVASPEDNLIWRFIYRNEVELQGSGRLPVWVATWERFLARPLFGSGLGVADTDSASDSVAFSTGSYSIEKGNSYLAALEELGLVGVTVLIGTLLIPLLRACWKGLNRVRSPEDKSNLVLIAIVIAGLVNTTFEAWLLSAGGIPGLSFWIFASLLLYRGVDLSKR